MKKASRHQGIKASRGKKKAQMREGITTRCFAAGLDPAWTCAPGFAASRRRAVGFTLVELMIAVLVLIVVIVATSQIFGTAGKVTRLGQATADVLQEAAAIERQIRSDFERLAPNGVFAIRCRSIANDINVPIGGPLLNPALPAAATIRADQLLFFTNGVAGTQVFAGSSGANRKQQGTAARIYYGHAFQVPGAEILTVSADAALTFNNGDPLRPWSQDPDPPSLKMLNAIPGNPVGDVDGTQPLASQWLLARQSVFLADDGGNPAFYLLTSGGINSTNAIWDLAIRNSRLDIAASQLNDIRSDVTNFGNNDWPTQRGIIGNDYLFYPRAERVAPSMDRLDHSLTANVLAGACSSFIVEWTYSNGVGEVRDDFGNVIWTGFQLNPPEREQPWFGLDADLDGDGIPERGVHFYSDSTWWDGAQTILPIDTMPNNLEEVFDVIPGQLRVYEAIFGYNRTTPLDPDTGQPWVPDSSPNAYTPWPSSIRITMFLHDPATKLEFGREIQFVINLPSRVE